MALFDNVFMILGKVTGVIRDIVKFITVQYYNVVLIILAVAGAYYLWKKYPTITNRYIAFAIYAIIIFLTLRFV
jgi:hypothetical protein